MRQANGCALQKALALLVSRKTLPQAHMSERGADLRPAPIDKLIARAGIASLREARRMVWAGRVTIDGIVQTSCWVTVHADDDVLVDGRPLPTAEPSRLFLFHKPAGMLDHKEGADGRAVIQLPAHLPRMAVVGGMGLDDEGVLLLTNDGGLAKLIEQSQLPSIYLVLVHARRPAAQAFLDESIECGTARNSPFGTWITITLAHRPRGARGNSMDLVCTPGSLRHVLYRQGYRVDRVVRIAFGPVSLGDLAEGEARELDAGDLRKQLVERAELRNKRMAMIGAPTFPRHSGG
jgi:23S rRNA pseudouridine2605 synthase